MNSGQVVEYRVRLLPEHLATLEKLQHRYAASAHDVVEALVRMDLESVQAMQEIDDEMMLDAMGRQLTFDQAE